MALAWKASGLTPTRVRIPHSPPMKLDDLKQLAIPPTPGSYQFRNQEGEIIYIGKAVNLRSRVFSYWRASANHTPAKEKMLKEIMSVEWIETDTEIEALLLEANLVKKYQPYYNVDLRDDKRFSYIKVSTEDEIPGVFVTRQIDKSGKYFGPFTSGPAVRETLKVIRKIWPYCTERKLQKRICFYAQIGRCTGVCGGQFSLEDYKEKIIKPILLFLEGKKRVVVSDLKARRDRLEKEMKLIQKISNQDERAQTNQASSLLRESFGGQVERNENGYEELLKKEIELRLIKRQLLDIGHVLASAKIIGVTEKYAADVVELAKVLRLSKVPERIEGYDISNIFGKEAVGSMVVFQGGEPNKAEYRKFKIKLSEGQANDIFMLKEVLTRRLAHSFTLGQTSLPEDEVHLTDEKTAMKAVWPVPDLIIVDGGKGQLNAIVALLKKYKLDIPAISVSKGQGLRSAAAPDKIFFPGEKQPLELPLASPALHVIKRVRDEAHRFAIKYHRELRSKNFKFQNPNFK